MIIESVFPFQEYKCYKVFHKKEGRWYVQLFKDKYNRTTIAYAKFLLSCKLGRILSREEQVDHKDNNKLNDDIDNLQILDNISNVRKYNKHAGIKRDMITWYCIVCERDFEIERNQTHLVKGGSRTFCSKECMKRFFGHKK